MEKRKALITACLLMVIGFALNSCKDPTKPCSTGGNCYVSGISVSGNWCKESRCAISKAGGSSASCDCN